MESPSHQLNKSSGADVRKARAQESRIGIASLVAPHYLGGLASYMRGLAATLHAETSVAGAFLCLQQKHPFLKDAGEDLVWPVKTLATRVRWAHVRWCFSRLAPRTRLHSSLERLLHLALPARTLDRLCSEFDVIHFVGTGWDLLGFPLLQAARRRKARFTVCPAVHPNSWGDDQIDVRLYRKADRVICFSGYEKEHLMNRGVPQEKIICCGLPPMCRADGNRTAFRATHQLGSRPVVFFLGRRDKGKGYHALLEAWQMVLRKVPDACLLLAGPQVGKPDELIDLLPVNSYRDIGTPDEKGKADALAACDVFCLPSAHESFGIVYVEAWSYGKPVICGAAPASRELVHDGITGLWTDGSPEAILTATVRLLKSRNLRLQIGDCGRSLQQREYTWSRTANAHLAATCFEDICI